MEKNGLLANAQKQYEKALKYVKLSPDSKKVLSRPKELIEVSIPVRMDSGKLEVFTGYRVHYNDARGPTKGGIRYHPDVSLDEVEAFATGDYARALLAGSRLEPAQRARIVKRLAAYTGLSADYLDRVNLRIEIMRFTKELLRDRKRTVGRLDSRFTGMDRDSGGETFDFDPSLAAIMGPYSAAFNAYVRGELGYESDLPYEILNGKTNAAWSYAEHENRYVEVAEALRKALCSNPHLKVFVANGYYDLATPYFATEYTFSHLSLDPALEANIGMGYYEAGHMMYVHEASLAKLKADIAAFFARSLP